VDFVCNSVRILFWCRFGEETRGGAPRLDRHRSRGATSCISRWGPCAAMIFIFSHSAARGAACARLDSGQGLCNT
jgi:hypothetical protein